MEFLYIVIGQFLLGMFAILFVVPIWLGVMHQAGACLLLANCVYIYFLTNHTDPDTL